VDEPGELDVGDVPACAVDALEIPDCFGAAAVCQYMASRVAG
jgi:hypothetical protein